MEAAWVRSVGSYPTLLIPGVSTGQERSCPRQNDWCEIRFTYITPGALPQNWCKGHNVREVLFTPTAGNGVVVRLKYALWIELSDPMKRRS